jgi:hypothetical protein
MGLAHQPLTTPRHVKVTGLSPAFGYERCEDVGCTVGSDGAASSCGRSACPSCGYGGTNISKMELVGGSGPSRTAVRARCSCGHTWVPGEKPA